MTFGETLRSIRERHGITQAALGKQMGLTQQAIAKYEGIKDPPKGATIERIAQALKELSGADISYITLLPDGIRNTEDLGAVIKEEHERRNTIAQKQKALMDSYKSEKEVNNLKYEHDVEQKMLEDIIQEKLRFEKAEQQSSKARVLSAFDKLNDAGQNAAADRIEELTEIPKYRKDSDK